MANLKSKASGKTAFITGASSGIGKASQQTSFARRFLPRALFDKTLRKPFRLR